MADRYADRYSGNPSHREDDGYGHPPEQGEGDPLAELARLIGQTDPFAGLPERSAASRAPIEDPPEGEPQMPTWVQRANHRSPAPPVYDEAPPQAFAPLPGYAEDDAAAAAASDFLHGGRSAHVEAAAYDPNLDPSRYDEALYGPADQGYAAHGTPPDAYGNDPYGGEHGYAGRHGDIDPPRRGAGLATVVALVALAVVGTAGAYGYRTLSATPRPSGEAPIIKADTGPNKVLPPAAQSGDATGKQIQDRAPAGQGGERLVSREEQPVDINAPGAQRSGPRIVFPPLTTNPAAPPPGDTAAQQPSPRPPIAATPNSGLGEPRKIRTVAVGPDLGEAPATAQPPAAASRAVSGQRAGQAPATSGNAPLSLTPQAAAPNPRVATTAPVTAPGAAAGSGSYLVQVASQRTEADAMASYRALQGKYPSVLGSRAPLIKRADLGGDKGVRYRAMVGPFDSRDEASQFCSSYMSAGGQCFVPRN